MTTTSEEANDMYHKMTKTYGNDICTRIDEYPYVLFQSSKIGKILGYANIRPRFIHNIEHDKYKRYLSVKTAGGNQTVLFISCDTLLHVITTCRKPAAIEMAKLLEIRVNTRFYVSVETDIVKCILTTFDGHMMIPQYHVKGYLIDLYFPEYSLAIECNENRHDYHVDEDAIRIREITTELGCRFICFYPQKPGFCLFKLLNDILMHISVHPKVTS